MLHFIQDAIVISLFWIVMRFRPDFILASFNTIGNICFKKGINRKSIYKTHGRVCLLYLFCVCSEIGSEMTYFIQERVGSKVADNNTNMSNSCHFITVAKNPPHYATQHYLIIELSYCLKNVYRILQHRLGQDWWHMIVKWLFDLFSLLPNSITILIFSR